MNVKWMVLVGLVAVLAHGADPLPDTVAAYRGRYEALKGRLDGKRDAAVGKALGVYRGELELLLANVRQQGKLDYVVAIQGELKRLETDPTAPKKPAAKRMKHLRRAQGGARVAEDQAVEAHGEGLARLAKSYAGTLRSLEKRLVAANEIEEAKLAREERAKIPKPVEKPKAEPKEEPKAAAPALVEMKGKEAHDIRALENGAKMHLKYNRTWQDVPASCAGWSYVRATPVPYPKLYGRCQSAGNVYLAVSHANMAACTKAGWEDTGQRLTATTGAKWVHEYRIVAREARRRTRVLFPKGMTGELAVYLIPRVQH